MTLTQKENSLLQDLKAQEQLCIEKYNKYAGLAHDPELKNLFTTLAGNEQKHLDTVNQILGGTEVKMPDQSPSAVQAKLQCKMSCCNEAEKKNDAYLCKDALSMEKHVSGVYNMGVFEPQNRESAKLLIEMMDFEGRDELLAKLTEAEEEST